MEKIAIFDTASGSTPPPVTTTATSIIYGQYATNQRKFRSNDSGWCNLCGGGNDAVANANDNTIRGNVFPANFDIVSDFYIAWGTVIVTNDMYVRLFELGTMVEEWNIPLANLISNSSTQLAFSTISSLRADRSYSLRFQLLGNSNEVEITGWSLAVKFNSLE